MDTDRPVSEISRHILQVLDPLLGRFTARRAVELVADHCGSTVDALTTDVLPAACERLRPMLRTLLGAALTTEVLAEIGRPFREAGNP